MNNHSKSEKRRGVRCYVGLWITGLIFYLVEEKSDFVRFHAKQSIATFLLLTILLSLFHLIFPFQIANLLNEIFIPLTIILWIICMYKAGKGEKWKIPLIGKLVESAFREVPSIPNRDERLTGTLCYAGLFVTGLIFYAIENEREFVKFHAKQSIITFLPLSFLTWIVFYLPEIGYSLRIIMGLLVLMLWVICMIKAYQGIKWEVPLFWDLGNRLSSVLSHKKQKIKEKPSKEEGYLLQFSSLLQRPPKSLVAVP